MPQESQSQSHGSATITSHPAVWPEQCRAGFGDANPHPGIICPSWGRRHHIMPCETKRYLVKEIYWPKPGQLNQLSLLGCSGHRRHLLPWGCVKLFHWKCRGRETAVKISYLKLLNLQILLWKPFYGTLFLLLFVFNCCSNFSWLPCLWKVPKH